MNEAHSIEALGDDDFPVFDDAGIQIIFDKAYEGDKKFNPKTDRWVTTQTGSRLLIRGGRVIGGAGGKLNGKNQHGVAQSKFSVSPSRYAKGKVTVRAPGDGGYKTQAGRIAEAVGGRWSHRDGGYIMAPSKAKLMEHLMDADAEASILSNSITIGDRKDMSLADAKKHLKSLGYAFDGVDDEDAEDGEDASAALDKAEPIECNVFKSGDKVVGPDGKDYTVTGQRGMQVSFKGEAKTMHANQLKLASGGKPERKMMDSAEDTEALDAAGHQPIMVQILSHGKRIGTMTPAEFMAASKAPKSTFLPEAIKKFNEWKEQSGEPERAETYLVDKRGKAVGLKSLDSAAELPGLRAALRTKGGSNFMERLVLMRQILEARSTEENVSAPGIRRPSAAALEVLALARASGQMHNAYAAAVAIQKAIDNEGFEGLTVRWDAVEAGEVPAFDAAGDDLFGGDIGGDKWLTCLVAYKGRTFATIYVRGDGQARLKEASYIADMDKADALGDIAELLGDWVSGQIEAVTIAEVSGWLLGIVEQHEDDLPAADEPGYVEKPKEMTHAERELAVVDALQDSGWSVRRLVAQNDDADAGTLTIIEAEYADADGTGDGLAWSIVKTDDSGAKKTESVSDVPSTSPQDMANVLIMTANAMEMTRKLSADEARQVANTIVQQLGGNKFKTMTGAKMFVSLSDGYGGLQFSLPTGFSQKDGKSTGINKVIIRLNGSDTYDVEFGAARMSKAKGATYKVIATAEDIYADMLQEVFTRYTGLDTSLGSMGKRNEPAREEALAMERADKIKRTDSAYRFMRATDDFKAWVSGSIDANDYSPFLTAKTLDEAAKAGGADVAWDVGNPDDWRVSTTGGAKPNGIITLGAQIIGRITMGGDGKAMIFVGESGGERPDPGDGGRFMFSEDPETHKEMMAALLRPIEVARAAKNAQPVEPVGAFKYALVNRPAMVGGLPRGLMYQVKPRPVAGQPHYEMARHGILLTERALTEAELKSFELAELIEGPELDRVAAEVAARMQKYAAQYVEAEQDNPGMFRDQVLDKAARPGSGVMRSIASPDALVDRVLVLLKDAVKASDEPPRRSEQFLRYMKAINEGRATPGMLEQINGDERLEDGEAEILIAAAKAAAEVVPAATEPFEYKGLKVSVRQITEDGQTSPRWQVQSPENAEREKRGERQIGGDALTRTREGAIQRADEMLREDASRKQRAAEADAAEAQRAAEAAARKERNAGKGIGELRADKTLQKMTSEGGVLMTRREWVERKVAEGLKPNVTQENRIQPMTRTQINRSSNEEQRAHDRKVAAAGKKDVYWIGDYSVSKTEYDYAASLASAAAAEPAAAPATTQRDTDMATLAEVAAGTHPEILEPEFVDQLVAIMERYPDDAELQALAEKAAIAQSEALLKAVGQ